MVHIMHICIHMLCLLCFQVIEAIRSSNNDEFFEAMEGGKCVMIHISY